MADKPVAAGSRPGKSALAEIDTASGGGYRSNDSCEISWLRSVGRRNATKPMHPGDSFAEGEDVGDNQYRVKSLRDEHERVVKESDLSASPT